MELRVNISKPEIHNDLSNLKIDSESLVLATERSIKTLSKISIPLDCQIWLRKTGYPSILEIEAIASSLNALGTPFRKIVAVGGGSTIDLAKALTSSSSLLYGFNELDLVCTNIGSGAELTSFATVWDFLNHRKISKTISSSLKRSTYYDFESFSTISRLDALIGALDAIAHAYDSYFSRSSSVKSKAMAVEAITELNGLLGKMMSDWPNSKSISQFHQASSLAATCIEQTKTSLSHGLSYGLTIFLEIPHGVAVGLLLREYLESYSMHLSKEIDLMTIELSLSVIDATLKYVLMERRLTKSKSLHSKNIGKVEDAIDWGRVENFSPVDNQRSHVQLLASVLRKLSVN